ncbi:zinc-finger protein [Cochliomyia hominivorax]
MKHEIVANSCRICLTQTKKLRSLYKPIDEGDEPPNEMLQLITGIAVEKLEEHETLPKNICKNCELSLNMAFEFRENALKTQEIIVEYLKALYQNNESDANNGQDENESINSSTSKYKSEYEDIMNLEPIDCVDALDDDIQDEHNKTSEENDEEYNEHANVEENELMDQDEPTFYKQQEHLEILKDDNGIIDENENYSDDQQDEQSEQQNIEDINESINNEGNIVCKDQIEIIATENGDYSDDENTSTKRSINTKTNRKKLSKIYLKPNTDLENLNDTNKMKLIPRRGRTSTNVSNQPGHICDICGNVFAKLGRMMEHRQRHNKELKYCCEICEQKFLTRELLRKHMFSHSGGKPLKCKYCSRTFYYESVRKAHEAVHQGHKPYVCDVCNKAFSYAHALKKHKLIHDEIKLYRCDYCKKDFRLLHHMKQHEMTKLHQNAVRFANSKIYEDCQELMGEEQDLNEDILFIEEIADDQLASAS